MNITKDIRYVGVNDREIDLFEGQYIVPEGMAYNSYVIIDEKIAVMDSVDARFGEEWIANIEKALDGKRPDFLVIILLRRLFDKNYLRLTYSEKYGRI